MPPTEQRSRVADWASIGGTLGAAFAVILATALSYPWAVWLASGGLIGSLAGLAASVLTSRLSDTPQTRFDWVDLAGPGMVVLFVTVLVVAVLSKTDTEQNAPTTTTQSTQSPTTTLPLQLTDLTASAGPDGSISLAWSADQTTGLTHFLVRDGDAQIAFADSFQSNAKIDDLAPTTSYKFTLVAVGEDDMELATGSFPSVTTSEITESYYLRNNEVTEVRGGLLLAATAPLGEVVATGLVITAPPKSCEIEGLSLNRSSVAINPRDGETLVITVIDLDSSYTRISISFTTELVDAPVDCFATE